MTVRIDNVSQEVVKTTTRTEKANRELDELDISIKNLGKKFKAIKDNITKAIEGNVDGAYNSTMESLKRHREAKASVAISKKICNQSKKNRKKLKKEILNPTNG